jgi:hypothetical protein
MRPSYIMPFHESRLKVKWAYKRIREIYSAVTSFASSDDFYGLSIEYDERQRTNHLRFDIHTDRFPGNDIALTIGDALHNLRSGLDLLWYETVNLCGGVPSEFTRFPMRKTREELVGSIRSALEKKQITVVVSQLMLETIKPYPAGKRQIHSPELESMKQMLPEIESMTQRLRKDLIR